MPFIPHLLCVCANFFDLHIPNCSYVQLLASFPADVVVVWPGADKIPVVDTQKLKLNGGESFEVISSPVLQVKGIGSEQAVGPVEAI